MSRSQVNRKRPDTNNQENPLQRFAAYIREQRLEEFIRRELQFLSAYDLPLLRYTEHLEEREIFEIARQSIERFLQALENNEYEAMARDNLARWENDELHFVGRENVSLQDILIINSAQKLAMLHFLPEFTVDTNVAATIASTLEATYQKAQLNAVSVLERMRTEGERKIRETEERYHDLFDNSSDLIHFDTPEGKLLSVNKTWKETLGYSDTELAGESLYFFICSKDRERFRAYRNQLMEGRQVEEPIRISLHTRDNREIIAEGTVSGKFSDGRLEYTRGIFTDVTKRVQNEEKLQFYTQQVLEREEKLRQLIQNAPDAIIVVNEADEINIWNPKAEEIFGWSAAEVLGMQLSGIIIPDKDRDGQENGIKQLLSEGETKRTNTTIEITARRKDGNEIVVSLTISRANLAQGCLFVSFLRDISEQKKNQMELEQQRIQLQRTNHELEQYAWVTSHDLKEPLRKIRTFSDMLLNMESDIPGEARNRLKKIHESAERMDTLIEAILMYSHSSANQSFEPVDLNETIREVLSDLELAINNKQAIVKCGKLPVVNGIPFQMHQLFQNLLSNALKYHKPEIFPEIVIHAKRSGKFHRITISDNGIGFREEFAAKIFQVFQRLVGKHEYEGTGIGLALCKKIAENHGGSIRASSKEGVGSTFEVSLPAT